MELLVKRHFPALPCAIQPVPCTITPECVKSGHETFEILGYISVVATCTPVCIILFKGKKFVKALLPLLVYAWLAALFEIAGWILNENSINNLVLIHLFTIVELTSLLFLYF